MSKELDLFIEELKLSLLPFFTNYNHILSENTYENTVDGYSGEWRSSLIYGNNIFNKEFIKIPDSEFIKSYLKLLCDTETLNTSNSSDYKVVGIEYNKLENVVVSPHCDDQNTSLERTRCFMYVSGGDFIFNMDGKEIKLSKSGDNILFDCRTEHYGNSVSSETTYAIIIDLMHKDIPAVQELGYMIRPLYYYLDKQCLT